MPNLRESCQHFMIKYNIHFKYFVNVIYPINELLFYSWYGKNYYFLPITGCWILPNAILGYLLKWIYCFSPLLCEFGGEHWLTKILNHLCITGISLNWLIYIIMLQDLVHESYFLITVLFSNSLIKFWNQVVSAS